MLNEWSDRGPRQSPRPFYRRGGFWVGAFVVAVCGGFLLGLVSCLAR